VDGIGAAHAIGEEVVTGDENDIPVAVFQNGGGSDHGSEGIDEEFAFYVRSVIGVIQLEISDVHFSERRPIHCRSSKADVLTRAAGRGASVIFVLRRRSQSIQSGVMLRQHLKFRRDRPSVGSEVRPYLADDRFR